MTLLGILLVSGLVVGAAVSGTVYVDCIRRDVPVRGRLLRTVTFGGVSFAGFLVPYALSGQLRYLYFQVLKPQPVAVSPYEWLAVNLTTGCTIGVMFVVLYFVGNRYRTVKTPESN